MAEDAAEGDGRDERFGEEAYKAASSPLFGRLWTYEELQAVDRPGKRKRSPNADFVRPDNWPADTDVERGSWVFWLPEGWAQGIRTQVNSGKTLSCYMSPTGKRFWHKKDMEKFLGRELPKEAPRAAVYDENGEKVTQIRYVTDPDAIPNWPKEEEGDWLPKDWKLGFRQLPSGLHRIYIPPGYDDVGFLYHRDTVMKWLSGEITSVSEFGSSRPFSSGSAAAAPGGKPLKKKHRVGPLTLSDFGECSGMKVAVLEGSPSKYGEVLQRMGSSHNEQVVGDAQKIQQVLAARGFEEPVLLYICFDKGDLEHRMAKHLSGFYFRRARDLWNDHWAYQLVSLSSSSAAGITCGRLYLSWSTSCAPGGCWKLGSLEDSLSGAFALCSDESMKSKWLLPSLPGD